MNDASLVGTRLGKYEIQAEIGRGGMGAVYKGYDPLLDRHVAVKVLAPHLVWQQGFVERFLREARAAARLQHPNIVTIYDVGQDGNWYYYVMEYLQGPTLTSIIQQKGPLPLADVSAILHPLAEALDHAHQTGLVHRDIKPGNIIVGPSGRVSLTDFGIARAVQETRLTATGAVVGTPEYMSPEQVRGQGADVCSDQYSLGVVAYEMLTGRVPFRAEDTLGLMFKVAHEPPPPIREMRSDLPPAVDGVLLKALAKEPGDRYLSVHAFVDALDGALAGKKGVAVATRQARPVESQTVIKTPGKAASAGVQEPAIPPTPRPSGPVVPADGLWPANRRVPGWAWAVGAAVVLLVLVGLAMAANGGQKTVITEAPTEPTVTLAPTRPQAIEATATSQPTRMPTRTVMSTPTREKATLEAPTATLVPTQMPEPAPTGTSTTAPTPTPTSTGTATTTATRAAQSTATPKPSPVPTRTPTKAAGFRAPVLVAPPNGQEFSDGDAVVLQWQPVGTLPEDGYYEVVVAYPHEGQTWYDETPWTRQTSWALSEHRYLLDLSDDGTFHWSVRVMQQTGTAENGRPTGTALSPDSDERVLVWRYETGGGGSEGGGGGGGVAPTRTPRP